MANESSRVMSSIESDIVLPTMLPISEPIPIIQTPPVPDSALTDCVERALLSREYLQKTPNPEGVFWTSDGSDTKVNVYRSTGTVLALKVGDFISYNRRTTGVRIDEFTYRKNDIGPMGFTYSSWRESTNDWAEFAFSMKGWNCNSRHVIAYPVGYQHYGLHIDWDSVHLVGDGTCPSPTQPPQCMTNTATS